MPTSPARPRVHFTAERGWINDPLGMTYVGGEYHLFFQYVPDSVRWQPNCHWGHAVSTDLVTWIEHDVALAPGEGDDGVWSGSIIRHPDNGPMLFYTSVSAPDHGVGVVRVATPLDDSWNDWSKGDPVVVAPEELGAVAFRDPYVFRDGAGWRMLVGTSLPGGIAAAASFSSQDCLRWTFDGLAAERSRTLTDPVWTGSLWECPQVFALDDKHVMVTSVWEDDVLHHVACAVGCYRDGEFHAESWHQLTSGDSYYAPSFFRDRAGEPCLIYWLRGPGGEDAGWKGALSVPHRLSLVDGRLRSDPHPSVVEALARRERDGDQHARLVTWTPRTGPLEIPLEKADALSLRLTEGGVAVRRGASGGMVPCTRVPEEVTVLVDAPVCEVFLGESVFAIG